MDLIAILAYGLLFYLGWMVFKSYNTLKLEKRNRVAHYLNEIIHQVNVETHYNIEYWFDTHTNKFLAQGKSMEEVVDVLKVRFPNHIFILEEQGGICAKTNWRLVPFETLKSMNFLTEER